MCPDKPPSCYASPTTWRRHLWMLIFHVVLIDQRTVECCLRSIELARRKTISCWRGDTSADCRSIRSSGTTSRAQLTFGGTDDIHAREGGGLDTRATGSTPARRLKAEADEAGGRKAPRGRDRGTATTRVRTRADRREPARWGLRDQHGDAEELSPAYEEETCESSPT